MAADIEIAFPKLNPEEIEALRQFGSEIGVAEGRMLFSEGDRDFLRRAGSDVPRDESSRSICRRRRTQWICEACGVSGWRGIDVSELRTRTHRKTLECQTSLR